MRDIGVGDRVKYRREFLRSIGAYTGPIPFARGVVTNLSCSVIATIKWDNNEEEVPDKVHVGNLAHEKDPERV